MIETAVHALVFPIEITRIDIFRDGGTVGVALKDAVGAEVELCLDGSIRRQTRDRFYWGIFYPGDNSGQLVARGSLVNGIQKRSRKRSPAHMEEGHFHQRRSERPRCV